MSLDWIAIEFSGHVVSGDHNHWRVLGTLKLSFLKNGITTLILGHLCSFLWFWSPFSPNSWWYALVSAKPFINIFTPSWHQRWTVGKMMCHLCWLFVGDHFTHSSELLQCFMSHWIGIPNNTHQMNDNDWNFQDKIALWEHAQSN